MAGKIRQEDIQAVRDRTDIVKVVSGYLQLRKAGRDSLVGICPFHAEKTASFSVSPGKQLFYCFGCQEGGDVFGFLRKIENLSFSEAVERLAGESGITLRYEGQSASSRRSQGKRQALHRAVEAAGRLYHSTLQERSEAAEARRYLAARGITQASVERFQIGYAPGYPDFLQKRLTRDFSSDLLVEAGLVAKDASGGMRDRFRGRVVFPIHDLGGNAVGFGGRLLAGPRAPSNAPKYVNSPDSDLYHKGSLLYNLNRAKADVSRHGRAFLVEGYTDVVALDQAGITTAVATCGTALGEEHLNLLARFTRRLVLAFDSDEAGARAAERAFTFHQRYDVDILVLVLPQGQDPADFAQARGEEAGSAFESLAETAVPLVEYMIDRSLVGRALSDPEERARAVRDGLAFVLPLADPVRRQEYARILAGKLGEPEMTVMLQLEQLQHASGGQPEPHSDRAGRSRMPPDEEVEYELLKLLVQEPRLTAERLPGISADWFGKPTHRRAFEVLREAAERQGGAPSVPDLVALAQERSSGEHLGRLIAALAVDPPKSGAEPDAEYTERLFLRLEEFALKRQIDEMRKEVERLNPLKAPAAHTELFERLVALEGKRRRVRAAAEAVGVGGPL